MEKTEADQLGHCWAMSLNIFPPTQRPKPRTSGESFVSKEDIIQAEILRTLKLVSSHQSYKSSADSDNFFQKMFPDSQIDRNIYCGEMKASSVSVYGLAEYFTVMLKQQKVTQLDLMLGQAANFCPVIFNNNNNNNNNSNNNNNNNNNNDNRLYLKRVTHLVTKLIFHEAL